jgi:ABC-type sugar transport system ATPase subunit
MDFDDRLAKAIERGQKQRTAAGQERISAQLTDEQFRTLHSQGRVELSERIEQALQKLTNAFPGFEYKTIVTPEGWGAKISRDDIVAARRQGVSQLYSHLELLVKPYTSTRILELVSRGAIRNKEVLTRSHFQQLQDLNLPSYNELLDQWVIEFAEKYAAIS